MTPPFEWLCHGVEGLPQNWGEVSIHWFFVEILTYFRLTVFQVTPYEWVHMIRLFSLFVEHKMGPPMAVEFAWFYSDKSNKNDEGIYYFAKRPSKGLKVITKIKDNLRP